MSESTARKWAIAFRGMVAVLIVLGVQPAMFGCGGELAIIAVVEDVLPERTSLHLEERSVP